jgi:hypothetical protein
VSPRGPLLLVPSAQWSSTQLSLHCRCSFLSFCLDVPLNKVTLSGFDYYYELHDKVYHYRSGVI